MTPGINQSIDIYQDFVCVPIAAAPTDTLNYVSTIVPRKSGFIAGGSVCEAMQTIQYLDGLGRAIQMVQVKGNPDGTKDLIIPMAYDQFGREQTKYLAYADSSNDGSYKALALTSGAGLSVFYNPKGNGVSGAQQANGIVTIPNPYSQSSYDGSPLDRTIEQGAPGTAWQIGNHTMHMDYLTNNTIDWNIDQVNSRQVVLYTSRINSDSSRTLINGGIYKADSLTVTVSKDENWQSGRGNTTEEYKDIEGRLILKRTYNYADTTLQKLSTYYVYDDLGNLSFVLPPGSNPDNITPTSGTTLNTLCYQYQYDEFQPLN